MISFKEIERQVYDLWKNHNLHSTHLIVNSQDYYDLSMEIYHKYHNSSDSDPYRRPIGIQIAFFNVCILVDKTAERPYLKTKEGKSFYVDTKKEMKQFTEEDLREAFYKGRGVQRIDERGRAIFIRPTFQGYLRELDEIRKVKKEKKERIGSIVISKEFLKYKHNEEIKKVFSQFIPIQIVENLDTPHLLTYIGYSDLFDEVDVLSNNFIPPLYDVIFTLSGEVNRDFKIDIKRVR